MSDNAKNASNGGFGQFVPGFEFLQNLVGGAGSANSTPQIPSLGNWVAPTFSVEDLDKRIAELKTVQFWLDQNAKALAATIQALEVQKMTLATLKTMNLSMSDVAQSLSAMTGFSGAAAATPAASPPTPFAGLEIPPRTYGTSAVPAGGSENGDEDDEDVSAASAQDQGAGAPAAPSAGAPGAIDPVQWWGALTQQFQQIASNALQDASSRLVPGAGDKPASAARGPAGAKKPVAQKTAAKARTQAAAPASAKKPAARPAKAPSPQPMVGGDWPMPTAFFQMPGLTGVGEPARKKAATSPAKSGSKKPAVKKPNAPKAAPAKRLR
jgi:hypothetical protein